MIALYTEKYISNDNNPWLVFLHGFAGNVQMWNKQVDSFKDRYNLLFIDLPGHGKSELGLGDKKVTKFEIVADMIVDKLREFNINKATFMCVSLGSLVFAGILSKYPDIVESAVLCGAVSGIGLPSKSLLNIVNSIKFALPYMIVLKIFAYVMMPFKSHSKSRKFFINSGKTMGRKEFMAWFSLLVSGMNILKNLKNIKKNILFISGSEDFLFISGVKKKYAELKNTKNLSLEVLNHCGHVCNLQKWREFNTLSLKYIDSLYSNHIVNLNNIREI